MMRSPRSPEADRRDSGNATVEFVLVGTLVVLIGLAVLQLILSLHVRNTMISAALEGARVAAQADRSLTDGVERSQRLIDAAIPGHAVQFEANAHQVDGLAAVVITARAPRPTVGLWGVGEIQVEGRALMEPVDG